MEITINTVRNDIEYDQALVRIKSLWGSTVEADVAEIDILTLLVDRYEQERWPIVDILDPVDVIMGAIEHAGHTRAELVALLGSASRASEILSRKRPLTLDMIRKVSEAWGLPIDLLTRVQKVRHDRQTA